jgi:hypothetical protein
MFSQTPLKALGAAVRILPFNLASAEEYMHEARH